MAVSILYPSIRCSLELAPLKVFGSCSLFARKHCRSSWQPQHTTNNVSICKSRNINPRVQSPLPGSRTHPKS